MLLATPKSWYEMHPNIELNFIPNKALECLKDYHYCVIENFTNNYDYVRLLYDELRFLEKVKN